MKNLKALSVVSLAIGTFLAGAGLGLQPSSGSLSKPFHNGTVWDVQFIRVKPGMDRAYLTYLSGQWKTMHEAFKKEGLIISYKVLTSEGHSPNDFNVMLMTEYKDLATLEANESKFEGIAERLVGDDQKQQQGYRDRSEIRDIIGGRLSREIVLEPKAK